jgi:hypothetical protein
MPPPLVVSDPSHAGHLAPAIARLTRDYTIAFANAMVAPYPRGTYSIVPPTRLASKQRITFEETIIGVVVHHCRQ